MKNHYFKHKLPKESGAVLITGMIFLVVLTIIVVSALRSGTLEERMAANARDRQLALQAVEAVVRDAEVVLLAISTFDPSIFTAACTNGYCSRPAVGSTPRWQTTTWGTNTRTFAATTSNLTVVASQPQYIVEYIAAEGGQPPKICPTLLFRITAQGVGSDSTAVFVESMLRHRPNRFADGYCG